MGYRARSLGSTASTTACYAAINLAEKLGRFAEHWSPRVVARMNDYHFKLVKIQGGMTIGFRDGEVRLRAGEMFVVPKGVEHRPVADRECRMMLVEPAGTINTGDAKDARTAPDGVWV